MQTKVSATKQNIPIGKKKKTHLEISGLVLCTKRYLPPGQAQAGVERETPHLRLRNQSLNELATNPERLTNTGTESTEGVGHLPCVLGSEPSSPLRLLEAKSY